MRETIASFLDDCLSRRDEVAFAVRRGLRTLHCSYARLATTAFQLARELEARGLKEGDRALIWGENCPEWVAAFFGCALRGVVVVPLDEESRPEFVERVQQQVAAKLLLHTVAETIACGLKLPALRLDQLSQAVAHHPSAPCQVDHLKRDNLLEIIFTSGTTAEPKGVCLTHRNLLANLEPLEHQIQKYLRWERPFHPIRFLNLLPLSHVFGQLMGIFVPQLLGGEVYFQPSLNPSEIIASVKRHRISVIAAVPRQLDALRDRVEREWAARGRLADFQQALEKAESVHFLKRWWMFRQIHRQFGWKFWAFVSGGATLDPETEAFWCRLGYAVIQGYGTTETASLVSLNHPFKTARGSIGKTLPGQEVKLDESGEILLRGENISPGYWGAEVKRLVNEEGWLRTGDIAEMDQAGNLYFKGRKKDVIVTAAGVNIYPADLEAALKAQGEVRDSVVIGVEGARGPEPLAVLIMRQPKADPAEAVKRANQGLSEYQQIRRWVIWPEPDFPRTATTQKVRKHIVAEAVKRLMDSSGSSSELPLSSAAAPPPPSSALLALLARITGEAPARLDSSATLATDLKLDSLGRVELLSALEDQYQIELDEASFTAATTVSDIERMIQEGTREGVTQYPYPEWTHHLPVRLLRLITFYLLILPLTRLMCWVRARGKEGLQELAGPALIVSNHLSMTDHALILSALPGRFRRRLAIAMEGEILRGFRFPPAAVSFLTRLRLLAQYVSIVTIFNVFPLPQKSGFRRSFTFAGEMIDRGYSVLVFPEGRRSEDGRMGPFLGGIGLLAKELNVPVVPVKIDGLFELKQRGQYFARPGQVTVTFGQPVSFSADEAPSQITKNLEQRVAAL